jgi:hypothetical protein
MLDYESLRIRAILIEVHRDQNGFGNHDKRHSHLSGALGGFGIQWTMVLQPAGFSFYSPNDFRYIKFRCVVS